MTTTAPPTRSPQRSPMRRALALPAIAAVAALVLTGCGDEAATSDLTRTDGTSSGTSAPSPSSAPATEPAPTTEPTGPADDGSTPDVPVPPAATTEVPDGFPLAAGLPDTNGDDGSPVAVTDRPTWTDVELCGEVVWSQRTPVATTDLAGASYTGEAEDSRSRLLALYADELGAQQALDGLRDAYAACPDGTVGGTEQVYKVVEDERGSASITHRYRSDGQFDTGLEVIEVVAIGNALYLSSYYGEGGGSPETIASAIELAHQESRPVWRAMAAFADTGTDTDTGTAPAGFPLPAGWPDDAEPGEAGVVFPVDDSESDGEADFARYTCGRDAPAADAVETLRGRYANVEDYRVRRLLEFEDADRAVAYVTGLSAFYDDCPEQRGQGFTYPAVKVDTEVGGQSFGVARFSLDRGNPTTGLSTLHVVRVGRAVLLDVTSNEGGAAQGAREAMTRDQLAQMTTDSVDVVAAMCEFTEAGC